MQHTEASVKIHFSKEYARFRMINGNRQLNDGKIKRIIKEITNGNDMLRYYPIQVREVKESLEILDGQHRFYISRHLKRPVFYILVHEEKSMPEIAKINSNVEKWSPKDYLNCYIQHGNKNYEIIQQFLDDYGFSLTVALLLLKTGVPGAEGAYPEVGEEFRSGKFTVEHLDKAKALAKNVQLFKNFSNHRSRPFVIAIHRIKKAGLITIAELYEEYKKQPEMLTQQGNYKAYVNILEQIVNIRKQKRRVII